MGENKKYPVSYNTFKNRILEFFLEKDWEYNTKFTREQKQEFLDNHEIDFQESYDEECQNYDKGLHNVFDTPGDTHKYILGLLFDCEMYFASKTLPEESTKKKVIDETKYPMTFKQFKEKMIELLIRDAGKISNVPPEQVPLDVEEFLKEQPTYLSDIYQECCEEYDNSSNKDKEDIFADSYLSSKYVWYWGMWMDYWFFL